MAKGTARGFFKILKKTFGSKKNTKKPDLSALTDKEALELAHMNTDRAKEQQKLDLRIAQAESAAGLGVFTGFLDSQTTIFGSKDHPTSGVAEQAYEPEAYAPVIQQPRSEMVYLPLEQSDSSLSENFLETGVGCDVGCDSEGFHIGGGFRRERKRKRKRRQRR